MENIIKRLDISVQEQAINEYLRLQKKIQSILDEGTPLNIAKTKELIEEAKKEYENSPTTKSYVHFQSRYSTRLYLDPEITIYTKYWTLPFLIQIYL